MIAANKSVPMQKMYNIVEEEYLTWKGNHKQMDDVLFIGIRMAA